MNQKKSALGGKSPNDVFSNQQDCIPFNQKKSRLMVLVFMKFCLVNYVMIMVRRGDNVSSRQHSLPPDRKRTGLLTINIQLHFTWCTKAVAPASKGAQRLLQAAFTQPGSEMFHTKSSSRRPNQYLLIERKIEKNERKQPKAYVEPL